MKFIHISDLHLGKTPDEQFRWGELRREELFKNLERMIEVCNNDKIELLLITGDLFDKEPNEDELTRTNDMFTSLTFTKVVIIGGESDKEFLEKMLQFSWNSNVNILSNNGITRVFFEDINTEVYGSSISSGIENAISYDTINNIDKSRKNILLAYGGDSNSIIIDFERISTIGFNYIALGQRHMYQQIDSNITYSGSLETLDKSEAGSHGYVIGEITDEGVTSQLIPFSTRNYYDEVINVDMNSTDESLLCYIETEINQYGMDNIFTFTIEGFRNPCINFSFEELFKTHNIMAIIDNSLPHYDYDILYELNKYNLIGKYILKVRNMQIDEDTKNKALYLGVEALIKKT